MMCFSSAMRPPKSGRFGSGHLVTTLGAVVALLCLVLGFRLLSQDPPQELRVWLAEPPVRSGLILALGGAFLVFLLGVALLLAVRRQIDSPLRKLGRGTPVGDPSGLQDDSLPVGSAARLAERELARWLEAQDRPPESQQDLQNTARRLRETVQEAERILVEIEAAARPGTSDVRDES